MSDAAKAKQWVEDGRPRYPSYGMAGGTKMEADAQDRWVAKYGRDPQAHVVTTPSIPESPRETHEPSKALSENERLRQFVEGVVEVCAWGRDAWVPIDDGGSVQDWGTKLGLLVPVAHQQPCTDEGCECDGATELLQFAWKVAPHNPESVVLESPAAPENQKNTCEGCDQPYCTGGAPQTLKDSTAIQGEAARLSPEQLEDADTLHDYEVMDAERRAEADRSPVVSGPVDQHQGYHSKGEQG